jgi:hypothetical protein
LTAIMAGFRPHGVAKGPDTMPPTATIIQLMLPVTERSS